MSLQKTGRLTQGPVAQQLILLSLPMMWGFLMTLSTSLVDTLFVAQLGTRELAALSFSFPVSMTLVAIAFGISHGAVSTVSRALGRGHPRHARQLATASISMAFMIALIAAVLGLFTIDPLFTALGAEPDLIPVIHDYMSIWYFSYPLVVTMVVTNGLFRAIGESRISSHIMTIHAVVNLILDPLLIFGLCGFPRLEVMGAAIGTLAGAAIALAYGLIHLQRQDLLARRHPSLKRLRILWPQIMSVALPSLGSSILNQTIPLLITMLLATHGAAAVASYGIVMRLEGVLFVVYIGLSTALAPMAGQNWGAQKFDRIMQAGRTAAIISIAWGIFIAAVLACWHEEVIGWFNASPEVALITAMYLVFVPFSYPGRALMNYYVSISNATGFAPRGLRMVIFYSLSYIVCAYLGNVYSGIIGVFAAKFAVNIMVGIISVLTGNLTGSLRRHKPDPIPTPPLQM